MKAKGVKESDYHREVAEENGWDVQSEGLQDPRPYQTFTKYRRVTTSHTIRVEYCSNGRTHSATLTGTKGRGKDEHIVLFQEVKFKEYLKCESVAKWLRRW